MIDVSFVHVSCLLISGIIQPITSDRRAKTPECPSTYRGVSWSKGRWQAEIRVNAHMHYIGRFDDEEAAARAFDEKVKQVLDSPIFLPDGSLNPDRSDRRHRYVELRIK